VCSRHVVRRPLICSARAFLTQSFLCGRQRCVLIDISGAFICTYPDALTVSEGSAFNTRRAARDMPGHGDDLVTLGAIELKT
jgi:hypothetical protein